MVRMHAGSEFRGSIVLLLVPPFGAAQTTISTGSIQGTISDKTGALVGGAKIMVVSQDTGQVLNLTTTSDGLYTSGALAAGHYIVRVQYPGFKTAERSLVVQVGVTSSANITLQVGEPSETVEVHESEVSVNTEQATIQGVLTTEQVSLPSVNAEMRFGRIPEGAKPKQPVPDLVVIEQWSAGCSTWLNDRPLS
jgi:hypothetical protein